MFNTTVVISGNGYSFEDHRRENKKALKNLKD